MNIAEAIKIGLSKKKINQKELAQFMGKSHPAISEWVNDKGYPQAEDLIKIIKFLDIADLLFDKKQQGIEMDYENRSEIKVLDNVVTQKNPWPLIEVREWAPGHFQFFLNSMPGGKSFDNLKDLFKEQDFLKELIRKATESVICKFYKLLPEEVKR